MIRANDSEDSNGDDYNSNPRTRSTGIKRKSSFLDTVNSIVAKHTRSINSSSSSAPRKERNNQVENPDVATVHSNTITHKKKSIDNSSSSAPRKERNNQVENPDVATVHSTTITHKKKSFQERFLELMDYESEYGHCMVPSTKNGQYYSLGTWCNEMRRTYRNIKKNNKEHSTLTAENIQRLEEIGFKWNISKSFGDHFRDLKEFKQNNGHCNVPTNSSLNEWAKKMRQAYRKIKKGEKPVSKLTEDNIKRLDNIGFNWSIDQKFRSFDVHFKELVEYKAEHGDCNVPCGPGELNSLGQWCSKLRQSYKKITNGEKPIYNLTPLNIIQLERIGFKLTIMKKTFDDNFKDLMRFKSKHGHCNVKARDGSLGIWCAQIRFSYKQTKSGKAQSRYQMSKKDVERLKEAEFF